MDALKVLKLSNGDEIIGFIKDGVEKTAPDDEITLSHLLFIKGPMRIVQKYDETVKSHALFLVDWMPTASSTMLPIPKDKVITMDTPNKAVEEHYMSVMGNKFPEEEYLTDEEQNQLDMYEFLSNHKFDDDDLQ